jgi:hypothetical protein
LADYDDIERQAPPTVVAAVAFGTAPVPFLAVYAVMFLIHGSVHPVVPPDITSTTRGEFWSGIVAAVLFVACSVALIWAISGARRWPFAATQLLLLVAAAYFLIDGNEGGNFVSGLIVLATFAALVLVFVPMSWPHYGRPLGRPGRRRAAGTPGPAHDTMPVGSAPVSDVTPASVRVAGRPRPVTSTATDPSETRG